MKPLRVLVVSARGRKSIPIVRALGEAGMEVFCADSTHHVAAFYSRWCTKRFVYPDPQSENFLDAVVGWLAKNPCEVIFPLGDDALYVLSKNRDLLPNPDALLLPDHEALALAGDKSRLIPYASGLGIAVPRTMVIRDSDDLKHLKDVPLPVIVKPSHGSGSRGIVRVKQPGELEQVCQSALADGRCLLVQEIIPPEGQGLGYFALYNRDRQLVAQFMHRRLREYPLTGGPSTLREGIWDEDLACQSRRLLESLEWVGVAMVEFKRDPSDGTAKLMEINPRFWGSIALPIFSGVNFPVLAAMVTAGKPVQHVLKYPVGKMARWFWPGDLLHLLASIRRGRWPRGFLKFFDPHTCYDILSIKDLGSTIAFIFSVLLGVCIPQNWRRVIFRRR